MELFDLRCNQYFPPAEFIYLRTEFGGFMTTKLFIAGLAVLLPVVANASVVKQRPFDYSLDVARATESDVFVICSNSPDDRISVLPSPPQLAMRLSQNEVRREEPRKEAAPTSEASKACVNCLLGTVQFPIDSAVLTQNERAKLDELIRGIPVDLKVNLDGYTCDLGSNTHNLSLSLRRAREVASYLRGKNISVGKIEGKGQCCPVSDDRQLNRRVEINTQRREEK
jgi:OOP family OmpA-OmpF porin